MHLGEEASAEEIIRKLERVYGVVESGATILQRFYNSRQEDNEGVAAYGCRLEDILSDAIDRGVVPKRQADEILMNKFWSGLREERVKNVVRHRIDQMRDFDSLLAEVRAAEQEVRESDKLWGKSTRRTTPAVHLPMQDRAQAPWTPVVESGEMASVQTTMQNMMKKMTSLEARMNQQPKMNEKLEKILARLDELELGKEKKNANPNSLNTDRNDQNLNSKGPAPRGRR